MIFNSVSSLSGIKRLGIHFISTISTSFGAALSKATVAIFFARVYGKSEYDEFATILVFVQLFTAFFDLGLADWAFLHSNKRNNFPFSFSFFVRLFFASVVFWVVVGIVVAKWLLVIEYSLSYVLVLFLIVAFQVGQYLFQVVYRANFKITVVAKLRFIQLLLIVVSLSFVWYLGGTPFLTLCVVLFVEALVLVVLMVGAQRLISINAATFSKLDVKNLFSTLWPFTVSTFAAYIYLSLDSYLLSYFCQPSDVGTYTAAYRLHTLGLQVGAMGVGVLVPFLYTVKPEFEAQGLLTISRVQNIFVLVMAVLGILVSEKLIILIYGDSFIHSGKVYLLLWISFIVKSLGVLPAHLLVRNSLQRQRMKVQLYVALFNLILCLLLIPSYGIYGALASTILSDLMLIFWYWYIVTSIKEYYFLRSEYIVMLFSFLNITLFAFSRFFDERLTGLFVLVVLFVQLVYLAYLTKNQIHSLAHSFFDIEKKFV